MAQFYMSHFHHGWYDTQFCMPMMVHHSYPHPTSPFPVFPCSTRINAPQRHGGPPPTNTPQAPKPYSTCNPSPPTPNQETTTPIKRPLRSILKHPRPISIGSQPQRRKSVRFTPSTASPPLAAPGTYKHAGRPKAPKARHPARSHPCLISTLQQRAQEAMAAVSGPPPPASKHVSNTSTPLRVQPCAAGDGARPRPRPPTPPPAAFFRGPDHGRAQGAAQSLPHPCNTSAPRQPAAAAAAPKPQVPPLIRTGLKKQVRIQPRTQIPEPAYSILYAGPYSSDSEDSNTDVRLATKLRVKKPQPTQMEVKAKAMTGKEEAAATRRSLKALAREFDRKNAWRRGGE